MKPKLFAVGILLVLGVFVVSRLASPAGREARMDLYRRRPWRQQIRGSRLS